MEVGGTSTVDPGICIGIVWMILGGPSNEVYGNNVPAFPARVPKGTGSRYPSAVDRFAMTNL